MTTASQETGPGGEALWELTENTLCHDAFCWPVPTVLLKIVFLKASYVSPRKSLKASSVATWAQTATECYRRFDFCLWARWGFSALACSRTGYHCHQPIQLSQCWAVENAIKIYIFLCSSRQIKLPVLDALGTQITRLYLKYNALYYIATT